MDPNGTEPVGKRPRLTGGYNDVVPVSAPGVAGAVSQAPAVSYAMSAPNVSSAGKPMGRAGSGDGRLERGKEVAFDCDPYLV